MLPRCALSAIAHPPSTCALIARQAGGCRGNVMIARFAVAQRVYAVASSCAGVTERAGGEQDFGHRQQRAAGGFPDHCVERIVELRRSVAGQADLNAATLEMKSVAQ